MLSCYIHVPFCAEKCRYCGFFSTPYHINLADDFLASLQKEMRIRVAEIESRLCETLYIGGGTPTILAVPQMQHLIHIVRENLRFTEVFEFTVEANPNSLSRDMLSLLKEEGVNRLSIGVQSFAPDILKWLGRMHTREDAVAAVGNARNAGFENISIDLIYGIPGLSRGQWRETLRIAVGLRPNHISAYSLSIDEGSKLYPEFQSGKTELPDDQLIEEQYEDAVEYLENAGYRHYEISNFCLPRFECRHNMNYWNRGEYIGMGQGAWSFTSNRRSRNYIDRESYLATLDRGQAPVDFEEIPDAEESAMETLFLGLRTDRGIDLHNYALLHGDTTLKSILARVGRQSTTGYYILEEGTLRLTRKGMLLSNDALSRIIS